MGQVALGNAGGGVGALSALMSMFVIGTTIVLPLLYFLPDIARPLADLLRRRNFLKESERDRRLEGRLFDLHR